MANQGNVFRPYVAASSSLDYNDQYLLSLLNQQPEGLSVPKFVYTSMGGDEDQENGEQKEAISAMFTSFNQQPTTKQLKNVEYKGEAYSNFKHLETAIASFSKGLFYTRVENR